MLELSDTGGGQKPMSELDPYAEPEVYIDELEGSYCDYGLEFCIDPQCRDIEGCVSCDYMCGVGQYRPKDQPAWENPFDVPGWEQFWLDVLYGSKTQ